MKIEIAQILTFASLFGGSNAKEKATSKLMVHIPHSLYKAEGYDHKEALFGVPPFGGSIAQNLFYADDDLCSVNVNVTKGYPERDPPGAPWPSPFILMVDRGTCSFTTKVRNAQRAGAAGVLIADNTCLCSATDCQSDLPCEATEPIMADDGSGGDITIPSMLLFKKDADVFKKGLMKNHPIRLEMTWSLPTPDDRVEYDLWTVPSDPVSKDFLTTFRMIAVTLASKAYFTPHMYIYDGARSNCIGQNNENQCDTLCTNNGRYCATDPDGDLDKGISGAQVVVESLRRLCIWEHHGRSSGIGAQWWTYVEQFEMLCNSADRFGDITCVEEACKAAGIDLETIHRCMRDSGGTNSDAPNNKLEMEISNQVSRGVVVIPTAYVNESPVRGALSTTNVFTAICSGYAPGTQPKICDQCTRCPDPLNCVTTGFCTNGWEHHVINHIRHHNENEKGDISSNTFFFTMIVCMGGIVAMGVWYQKRNHVEMREQMRTLLAQYMPLDDEDMGSPMDFNNGGAQDPLIFPEPQEYQGPQGPPQYRQPQPLA